MKKNFESGGQQSPDRGRAGTSGGAGGQNSTDGARFPEARRNTPYYANFAELRRHHARLFERDPAVVTRHFRIGEATNSRGSILQTTVRLRADVEPQNVRRILRAVFARLFRLQPEGSREGFEVVVTFNAVLTNSQRTSFSVFYGHDHRAGNVSGAAPELTYGDTSVVRSLVDVAGIPVQFDFEQLAVQHRATFEESGIAVYKFINLVYLIYTYSRQ